MSSNFISLRTLSYGGFLLSLWFLVTWHVGHVHVGWFIFVIGFCWCVPPRTTTRPAGHSFLEFFAKAFVCFLNLVITGNILMSCWSFFILGILLDCSTLYTYGVTRAIQGFLEQSVVKFWVFLHFWLYISFFVCAVLVLFLDGRDARSIHDNLVPIHAQPLNCMALTIPFCLG